MQQRELRLGDILDDYCPRERRITNHAIVAMVGSDIKQTRCTTCDAEHPYKAGKIPPQRKRKDAKASLYDQVLTAVTEKDGGASDVPALTAPASMAPLEPPDAVTPDAPVPSRDVPQVAAETPAARVVMEEGRVHRTLIRATLPRTEGQSPARPVPEFTVRQARARQGRFDGHPGGAGGRHPDRHRGRGPADQGIGSRGPSSRPGPRRPGRPDHGPHPVGARPVPHPHPSRRPPGAMPRSGKKPSK
jgi:hypothetical protein